jgi:peptide/nickel transport system substrate-binding protein
MKRHRLLPLLLLLAPGCADGRALHSGAALADDLPAPGGTAVVGFPVDLDNVNPLTATNAYSVAAIRDLLFLSVLRLDDDMEPVPYLARAWELNADGTELTFHLRDDVFWHDGVRTTAHDLHFSYELYRDPRTPFRATLFRDYYGAGEVVDSFTYRVRLRPHADFLQIWTWLVPVPRHVLEGVEPEGLRLHPFGTVRPLGNGPFRFVGRDPNQSWTFDANPEFPAELGGRPYLDRVVYRVIPESTTLLTELLTGQVHYARLPASQIEQVEESRSARAHSYRTGNTSFVAWNTRRAMFADPRVRRALTMAIDRQAIIDGIVYGRAEPASSMVPPITWAYDHAVGRDLPYDPEGARRLLAEAGWEDRDRDGVLENAEGKPFRFTLIGSRSDVVVVDMAEKITSDLARIGVRVEPRLMEFNTMLAAVQDRGRDFDAATYSMVMPTYPVSFVTAFHCGRREQIGQISGICDAELDALMDRLPTVVDPDAALPIWSRYQERLSELQPYTFLHHRHEVYGASTRLRGVAPDARGFLSGIARWWLAPG